MVRFLRGSALEMRTQSRIAGSQSLGRIQRLSTHLAHVVDSHQRCRVLALIGLEPSFVSRHDGTRTGGSLLGKQGCEGAVGGRKQLVHGAKFSACRRCGCGAAIRPETPAEFLLSERKT